MCLEINVACRLALRDMRHVQDLRLNLIFGFALSKQGCESHVSNGKWKLSEGSWIVAKGNVC